MRLRSFLALVLVGGTMSFAQVLSRRPETPPPTQTQRAPAAAQPITVALDVPAGTPLKIAVDTDVRVREVGQPVHGRVVEPVYAFDSLVIPVGTEAIGRISGITGVSGKARTLSALNADFSPARRVQITFDELHLEDGRVIPIHTEVTPGSAGVLKLVAADVRKPSVTGAARNAAARRIDEAKQEVHKDIESAKAQVEEPGKMHRLERLALAQLPYRPQYIGVGSTFNAELQQPLSFGSESFAADSLSSIGTAPTSDLVLHAELVTPLDSATSKKGDAVQAVITEPAYSSGHLLFPEGSRLLGSVTQVRPARRLNRNGLLRVVFQKIVPPNGLEQKIAASLDAVEVAEREHLALDSEGGAQVTTPRTRYFTTALSLALAASTASPEHDRDADLRSGGADAGNSAATGASGFKLVGTLVGTLARSRVVSSAFGFYGAGISVYSHFLARGREVVYPKDMTMLVGLAAPPKIASAQATEAPAH